MLIITKSSGQIVRNKSPRGSGHALSQNGTTIIHMTTPENYLELSHNLNTNLIVTFPQNEQNKFTGLLKTTKTNFTTKLNPAVGH